MADFVTVLVSVKIKPRGLCFLAHSEMQEQALAFLSLRCENNPMSTGFAQKVLEVVKKIPKGKVLTYKEVAKLAGRPKAWRAVGNILSRNRDPAIPCHRVVRSDGKPGGFNRSQKKKLELLRKEGAIF